MGSAIEFVKMKFQIKPSNTAKEIFTDSNSVSDRCSKRDFHKQQQSQIQRVQLPATATLLKAIFIITFVSLLVFLARVYRLMQCPPSEELPLGSSNRFLLPQDQELEPSEAVEKDQLDLIIEALENEESFSKKEVKLFGIMKEVGETLALFSWSQYYAGRGKCACCNTAGDNESNSGNDNGSRGGYEMFHGKCGVK